MQNFGGRVRARFEGLKCCSSSIKQNMNSRANGLARPKPALVFSVEPVSVPVRGLTDGLVSVAGVWLNAPITHPLARLIRSSILPREVSRYLFCFTRNSHRIPHSLIQRTSVYANQCHFFQPCPAVSGPLVLLFPRINTLFYIHQPNSPSINPFQHFPCVSN